MKFATVVGVRPQFIKCAPVSRAVKEAAIEVLIHTGQHYDSNMSDLFFRDPRNSRALITTRASVLGHTVLAARAEDCYIKPKPMAAPYMIIAFDSRPEMRFKYPAGQHPYDHSIRPQEVSESWNPDFYRLLKFYEEITGEGIILNTSYNLHDYPIVYKLAEAIDVLNRSGLKFLALGNWWVWKE